MSKRKQDSADGRQRMHVPLDGRDYPGNIVASQVPDEQSSADFKAWRRDLLVPEDAFERSERLARELERRHGTGPTSLAAARAWAADWRAS